MKHIRSIQEQNTRSELDKIYHLVISLPEGKRPTRAQMEDIEEAVKSRLRIQAAFHRRSMEDEAREILWSALNREPAPPGNLATSIRNRFKRVGGIELPPIEREAMREPPAFEP